MKSISFSSKIVTIDNYVGYADDADRDNENKDVYSLWYSNEELEAFCKNESEEISTEAFYTIISSILAVLKEQTQQRKRHGGMEKQQLDPVRIAEAYSKYTQQTAEEAYSKGQQNQKDAISSYMTNPSILLSSSIRDRKIIKRLIHDVALYFSSAPYVGKLSQSKAA